METIKNAANAVGDKINVSSPFLPKRQDHHRPLSVFIQEMVSGTSAECNKEKAKDSSNTAGERIGAGIDYVKDKAEEAGHAASKEVNKQKAMH